MRTHRFTKLATGLLATGAAVCLMALPASANTVGVDTTDGDMELYDMSGGLIDTIDMSAPGTSCGASSSSVTTTGSSSSGTFTASIGSNSATTIAGTHYKVVLTTNLSGSYTGSAVSGGGTATAVLTKTTAAGSCTPLSGVGTCTVTAGNLAVSGSFSAADPSNLVSGDSATLSGGNGAFESTVTGSASDCGVMIAMDNGYASILGAEVTVL